MNRPTVTATKGCFSVRLVHKLYDRATVTVLIDCLCDNYFINYIVGDVSLLPVLVFVTWGLEYIQTLETSH